MKAIIFFILFTVLAIPTAFAQIKIGDNPQNIDASSVLELESTSKVLVITRVTTLEMEAITPQRGGMVYNTDTECINYYDGTKWVNLCDAVNFSITNDPIINGRSTIEITEAAGNINLEVAKNSILGDNIIDGGIGPDDIQDNSITQDKLAAESVGSSELRQNSVGSEEIRDASIAPADMANFIAGQVLTTDENGIVQWEDSDGLFDLTFNKLDTTLTIARSTIAGVSTISLGALIGSDDQQLNLTDNILSIENDPNTIDLSTYLQELSINPAGTEISLTNGGTINLPQTTGSETKVTEGDNITISGDGTTASPYIINTADAVVANGSETIVTEGNNITITGNGTTATPYVINAADGAVVDGTETILQNGTNVTITGDGSSDDPYIINASEVIELNNGTILIGNGTGEAAEAFINGDATMNDQGLLTIEEAAVTPLKIEPGLDGQFLSTAAGAVTWVAAPGGTGGSTEVADGTTISGTGAALSPFTITPGADGEFLSTNVDGDVVWAVPTGSTGGTTEVADGVTISGDGTTATPFTIAPAPLPLTKNQILITNSTTGIVGWDDIPEESGGTVSTDGTTITGDGESTDLSVPTDGISSTQILNETILLEDLSNMGANTTGQILKWNEAALTWELGTDIGSELPAGQVLIGNATDQATPQTLSGDATIDNAGVVTITADAVENTMIAANVAGNGLAKNITTGALDIIPGTVENQILKWNNTTTTWELGTDVGGTLPVGQVLIGNATGDATPQTLSGDATIDNTGVVTIAADAVDNSMIDPNVAGNGLLQNVATGALDIIPGTVENQILKWNNTTTTWELGTDVGGTLPVGQVLIGNATGDATPQTLSGDATIDNTGVVTIAADAVDNSMIDPNVAGNGLLQNVATGALDIIPGSAANQILKWNITTTAWELGTDNGNVPDAAAGTILFSDGSNAVDVDETELFWDQTNNRLGIGTNTPSNKLEVDGEVRSQGYSNSNGTPNEPAYSFTNDTDTGMFRGFAGGGNAPVNWLRFATGGTEAITINPSQFVGIGPDFASGTTIDTRLHVDGDIRAEGAITASGTITTVPDYVFQKYFLGNSILNPNYEFSNLSEIEKFVKENNHLPGIKSAATIKEQGFWDLGEASRVNLEKIEELFLHTIEQEKKIKELQSANTNMSTELEGLKAQMAEIKTMLLEKQND